ncbi:MAG: HD domain-containing protein [Bacilli bacterium]|nr:HD domain-containing protein [Bacilli bacterium]
MKKLYDFYLDNLGKIPTFLDKYITVPSLVRLKNIGYFCGMDYASKDIYDFAEYISRFDHSLTVALLTYKYTQDKKATIAALFHDVATPCFAHVIDYMNKDYATQESTEEYTEKVILNDKELLKNLKEDNIEVEEIIDFKKYSIVDLDRPRLCADRVDGIILTSIGWTKTMDIDTLLSILNHLEVYLNEDGKFELGFNDSTIGLKVLELNNLIDIETHSNYDNYMMELLANITRMAIDNNIVKYDDLYYLKEDELFTILNNCSNTEIKSLLDKFYHIKKDEIKEIEIKGLKRKIIKPLIKGVRYNEK